MRIDVVTIFPDYLLPLGLSLVGRARAGGVLDLRVHDLRAWTHDRHRTVDDSPYGGGAGMVMRPEPWGGALDALVPDGGPVPTFVVPTPAGRPFTQATAERLAEQPWLLLGCGRYEGMDQRVVDHAATRMPVEELSVGDYVLAGGEAAALVVVEAVTRVLPGVLGNPRSLAEESHHTGTGGGLLEAPGYTRPAEWRGLAVPEALVSGDHGRAAAWRHEQAVLRTRERRPDLLPVAEDVATAPVAAARPADAAELLVLQRCCWVEEAQANDAPGIPPLRESLGDVARDLTPGSGWTTWCVRVGARLVGSVRARVVGEAWEIGRLMVAPDARGRGLGRRLLEHAEAAAPDTVRAYELFTGAGSDANLRRCRRAGYRPIDGGASETGVVRLRRERSRRRDETR